jgi:hypothetical protein
MKTAKKRSKGFSKNLLLVGMFSLALAFGSVGGAFAENPLFDLKSGPTPQKSVVFVDAGTMLSYLVTGGLGVGAGYEKSFGDTWTGLIHAAVGGYDYGSGDTAFSFQLDVHGRYYIFKTALDKLFLDLGLGYEYYGRTYESNSDWNYSVSSLTITPKVGWKFIFGKGFVVEPAFGWTIGIGLNKPDVSSGVSLYTAGGPSIGVGLGWAF